MLSYEFDTCQRVFVEQRRYDESVPLVKKAGDIRKSSLGIHHPGMYHFYEFSVNFLIDF